MTDAGVIVLLGTLMVAVGAAGIGPSRAPAPARAQAHNARTRRGRLTRAEADHARILLRNSTATNVKVGTYGARFVLGGQPVEVGPDAVRELIEWATPRLFGLDFVDRPLDVEQWNADQEAGARG